jgi:MraZ protein
MAARLIGTHVNKIDKKGRVSVPKPFRDFFKGQEFAGIYVFRSFKDAAIEGAGDAFMDDIVNRLDDLELFSDEQEDLAAVILQNSFQLPFDPEGRVVLPRIVMDHAGLTSEAVFAGRGRRFQIWQPEAYEENNLQTFERVRSRGATLPPPRRAPGGGGE